MTKFFPASEISTETDELSLFPRSQTIERICWIHELGERETERGRERARALGVACDRRELYLNGDGLHSKLAT